MELFFKITAGLLLLVQAFQSVSLQHSTDSPGRTIDKSWLRDLLRNRTGGQGVAIPTVGMDPDQVFDTTLDSGHDYSGAIPSGSMAIPNEEEENRDADEESDDLNVVATPDLPVDLNMTTQEPFLDVNISVTTLDSANTTGVEKEPNTLSTVPPNSTTFATAENSTHLSGFRHNDSLTTPSPGANATQEATTTPTEDASSINATEPADTTTTTTTAPTTTTKFGETSSSSVSARSSQPSTSSETGFKTTSSAVEETPEVANKTGTGSGTGSSSERGGLPVSRQVMFTDAILY